ncbi:MAG TPA: hypothetical protein VFN67_22025 [Polyangiales bacterium]|nr:hypothetical protein [Polyangiales bacterium]
MHLIRLMRFVAGRAACLWVPFALACASGKEFSGPLPSPDGEQFVKQVYPLLLRDCAHVGCHGLPERFFQLYGPGRARIPMEQMNPATRMEVDFTDPANFDEVMHSYQRTLSMLATAELVEDSLLLRKPLEVQAGGQGHKGVDDLGRNVFVSKQDPGWQMLLAWSKTRGAPPTAEQVAKLNQAAAAGELNPMPGDVP